MDDKITIEKLKDPKFLESTKQKLEEFLNYDSGKEARDLAYDLDKALKENPGLAKSSPDFYAAYQDIIIKMKLIGLAFLTDQEIVSTLKDHFSIMLLSFPSGTNNIVAKLRAYLVGIPVYEERDILKGKVRQILLESQEELTTKNIKGEKGIDQPPTISNWIKNYMEAMQGAEEDSLRLTMYLTNARSKMSLSDKESDALKALLLLYEFLRKSSLTPEGLEESVLIMDNGTLKTLEHGELEEVI